MIHIPTYHVKLLKRKESSVAISIRFETTPWIYISTSIPLPDHRALQIAARYALCSFAIAMPDSGQVYAGVQSYYSSLTRFYYEFTAQFLTLATAVSKSASLNAAACPPVSTVSRAKATKDLAGTEAGMVRTTRPDVLRHVRGFPVSIFKIAVTTQHFVIISAGMRISLLVVLDHDGQIVNVAFNSRFRET